jgi:hypothetical protein
MPECPWRDDRVTIACLRCGRAFGAVGRQRYCSAACRQAGWRQRHPAAASADPRPPRSNRVRVSRVWHPVPRPAAVPRVSTVLPARRSRGRLPPLRRTGGPRRPPHRIGSDRRPITGPKGGRDGPGADPSGPLLSRCLAHLHFGAYSGDMETHRRNPAETQAGWWGPSGGGWGPGPVRAAFRLAGQRGE